MGKKDGKRNARAKINCRVFVFLKNSEIEQNGSWDINQCEEQVGSSEIHEDIIISLNKKDKPLDDITNTIEESKKYYNKDNRSLNGDINCEKNRVEQNMAYVSREVLYSYPAHNSEENDMQHIIIDGKLIQAKVKLKVHKK